ncbi:hypothetical protein C8F01DRAFT_1079734 [Mycena amicta]|nr:hypothetical protein C8F01DRAFT_1079734 [Mycena amicta]
MSNLSESSSSSALLRRLAAAEARNLEFESRILQLESTLATLTVDSPRRRPLRDTPGRITRPGPRLIPLPSASPTVSGSSTIDDTSVIIVPDSDDDEEAPGPPHPPSSPPTPPPPPSAEQPSVPPAVRREYIFSSPTVAPTRTTEWSEAAQNTQGVRNAQVRVVSQQPARRKRTVCWTVFRGRTIGVFASWDLAQAATSGFRLAIYHGYSDLTSARQAFDYAEAHHYMATRPQDRGLPLPLDQIPTSIVTAHGVDEARLQPRAPDDLWYIVYQGVNPGIYPTYLEAALNTNGIRLTAHDSRETLSDAITAFEQAQLSGGVVVRREPTRA